MNDFQFAKTLEYKLFSTLQQYSVGKPILVFCPTRKGVDTSSIHFIHSDFLQGVFGTAEQLMKEYLDSEAKKTTLPWSRPARSVSDIVTIFASYKCRLNHSFSDKRLDGNL